MLIKLITQTGTVENMQPSPAVALLLKHFGDDTRKVFNTDKQAFWPLPNAREITDYDFWWHRSSWSFTVEAWIGQIRLEDKTYGTLMLYGGGGQVDECYAVLFMYGYPRPKGGVRYFVFSKCKHEYAQKNIGNCLNRYTCKHCGHKYDVDSSD